MIKKEYLREGLDFWSKKAVEETGEFLHAMGKSLCYGWESTHPNGGETNREWLLKEIADVKYALAKLQEELCFYEEEVFK